MSDRNIPTERESLRRRYMRLRERISWRIRKQIANAAAALIRAMRRVLRWTGTRCSWCGRDCGFESSYSRKGLRCNGFTRDCQDLP